MFGKVRFLGKNLVDAHYFTVCRSLLCNFCMVSTDAALGFGPALCKSLAGPHGPKISMNSRGFALVGTRSLVSPCTRSGVACV